MGVFICSPEDYYSTDQCIKRGINRDANAWIYDIIQNSFQKEPWEHLIYNDDRWSLVFHKTFKKILIVFKDRALQSLRDLRARHIPLLFDIRKVVTDLILQSPYIFGLQEQDLTTPKLDFYFHYHPTVFQLHAHVVVNDSRPKIACRCHDFRHVIRNLRTSSSYYKDALILSQLGKQS